MTKTSPLRPIVVKIGGSMMDDEAALRGLCKVLAGLGRTDTPSVARTLNARRAPLVLVHGGGKDINRHLAWLQEEPDFKDGLRVTGTAALKVVEMTLSGYVNKKLVGLLNAEGGSAAGISGVDGPTLVCEKISEELGQVGRIVEVRTALVDALLAGGFLPVVSPISVSADQTHYNVNADDAAAALAAALHAEKLIFVSDVEGVRGADGVRIPDLTGARIDRLIADGVASGGMIPKLKSCRAAINGGIGQVHICGWAGPEKFAAQVRGEGNTGTIIK
ncbi:MAG: acetylglutamate kinase [Fibrobacterota bacterium]|nr:acetylglutamate kinase [Fibrobacterota bacterium]